MNSKLKENMAPTIVLVSICLIASMMLAATYQITAPIIEKTAIANANAARAEVLDTATGFTEMTDMELQDGILEVFEAENGVGYVITSQFKGFGGPVTVMTGISPEGLITGVKVTDASNETPGLGSKATVPQYMEQFKGASYITTDKSSSEGRVVDAVSGATITSRAVFSCVAAALMQYTSIGGGV